MVAKQTGRAHPQDPTNPEMRLYWVYRESTDTTKNLQRVGTRVSGKGHVPANKAAAQAVVDGVTGFAADFGKGKGAPAPDSTLVGKGKGKTKSGEPPEKKRKAHPRKLCGCCPTFFLFDFVKRGCVTYKIYMVFKNYILHMVWGKYPGLILNCGIHLGPVDFPQSHPGPVLCPNLAG